MKRFLTRLPILKQILATRSDILMTRATAERQLRMSQEHFLTTLLASSRYSDPKKLNRYEGQVFSQNGEDGIIAEIFSRIGCTTTTFVEFGAGNGIENNSAYLLFKGWSGYWFEGARQNVDSIRSNFDEIISTKRLIVSQEFFTAENAAGIFERHGIPKEFDLLSIDIDRNTSWIWQSLGSFRPGCASWNTTPRYFSRTIGKSDIRPTRCGTKRSFMARASLRWRELGRTSGIRWWAVTSAGPMRSSCATIWWPIIFRNLLRRAITMSRRECFSVGRGGRKQDRFGAFEQERLLS